MKFLKEELDKSFWNDTIDLEYDDIEVTYSVGDYYDGEDRIATVYHTYEITNSEAYEVIEDLEWEIFKELDYDDRDKYFEEHYDELIEKHMDTLLSHFRKHAEEDASDDFDIDDYETNWDAYEPEYDPDWGED